MSRAFQCDRCHEYFTTSEIWDDNKMSRIDCTLYGRGDEPGRHYHDRFEDFDLCPDCTKALMLFLDNHSVDGEGGYYAASWVERTPEERSEMDVPYISKEQEAAYAPPSCYTEGYSTRKNDTDHNEKEGGV